MNTNQENAATNEAVGALQTLTISCIKGDESIKATPLLLTGRQSKNIRVPRKDMQLSQPLPICTPEMVPQLNAGRVATLITDSILYHARSSRMSKLNIGDTLKLTYPLNPVEAVASFLQQMTSIATRTRKQLSSASLKDLLGDSGYIAARLAVMGAAKLVAWGRIGEQEMMRVCLCQDASLDTGRKGAQETAILRMLEISSHMPEGVHRNNLEAFAAALELVPLVDMDGSI